MKSKAEAHGVFVSQEQQVYFVEFEELPFCRLIYCFYCQITASEDDNGCGGEWPI